MVRVFATLKLRLLRNILRTDSGVTFVLFSLIALFLGGAAGMAAFATDNFSAGLLPLGTFAILIAWTFGPLLFGAADETIDSTRLALFPVPARQLAPGMVVANLIGPGPVAILIPFVVVAFKAATLAGKLLAFTAALSTVLLASVLSRWIQTLLGSALRKRNRRDLVIVIAGLFAGVLGIGSQVLLFVGVSSARLGQFGAIAQWLPGGWTGWALQELQTPTSYTYLVSLAAILATLAFAILASWQWIVSLERALSEVTDGGVDELTTGHFMDSSGIRGAVLTRLGPYGPVLAKEIRYLRRHPRYRVQVVTQFIVLILGGAPFLAAVMERNPTSVLVACVPALTAGITSSNLLGADGRALWAEVLAVDSMKVILRGRSLAFFGLGVGSSVIVIIGTAAWTGGWRFALIAFAASIGMGFAGAGTGALTSTLAPVLLPDETNPNPFASGDMGQGCVSGIFTLGGALIGLLTSAPILAGLAFARTELWAQVAVILIAPIYGFGIYLLTTTIGARRADPRIPEIIAALT